MKNTDYLKFILSGQVAGVELNDYNEEVISKIGSPISIQGNESGGFLHYDILRFGYNSKKMINEISIYFVGNSDIQIPVTISHLSETYWLSNSMLLHEFLFVLNHLKVSWKAEGGKPGFGIQLKVNNVTTAIFDEEGLLYKIAFY